MSKSKIIRSLSKRKKSAISLFNSFMKEGFGEDKKEEDDDQNIVFSPNQNFISEDISRSSSDNLSVSPTLIDNLSVSPTLIEVEEQPVDNLDIFMDEMKNRISLSYSRGSSQLNGSMGDLVGDIDLRSSNGNKRIGMKSSKSFSSVPENRVRPAPPPKKARKRSEKAPPPPPKKKLKKYGLIKDQKRFCYIFSDGNINQAKEKFNTLMVGIENKEKLNNSIHMFQKYLNGYKGRVVYAKRLKDAQAREQVARELLKTEITYVGLLELFVNLFLYPLRDDCRSEKPMMTENEVRCVFSSSLESILECNRLLKDDITNKVDHWHYNQTIGDVFRFMTEHLKLYTEYITNYNVSLSTYESLRKKNKKFDQWITEKEKDVNLNFQKFESLLILPVQRIPRYSLLLKELLKHTSHDHDDYEELQYSLKKMENVAIYLNDKKAESENIARVNEIWSRISGMTMGISPSRRIVREGEAYIEKGDKERKLYLFNDVLLIVKLFKKGFKKSKEKIDVSFQLGHISLQRSEGNKLSISYNESEALYTLRFEDQEKKEEWAKLIEVAASSYKEKTLNMKYQEENNVYVQPKSSFRFSTIRKISSSIKLLTSLNLKETVKEEVEEFRPSSAQRTINIHGTLPRKNSAFRRSRSLSSLTEIFNLNEGQEENQNNMTNEENDTKKDDSDSNNDDNEDRDNEDKNEDNEDKDEDSNEDRDKDEDDNEDRDRDKNEDEEVKNEDKKDEDKEERDNNDNKEEKNEDKKEEKNEDKNDNTESD